MRPSEVNLTMPFDRAREKYTNKAKREYEKEKRREKTVGQSYLSCCTAEI